MYHAGVHDPVYNGFDCRGDGVAVGENATLDSPWRDLWFKELGLGSRFGDQMLFGRLELVL